jgi:hypothetical protein
MIREMCFVCYTLHTFITDNHLGMLNTLSNNTGIVFVRQLINELLFFIDCS